MPAMPAVIFADADVATILHAISLFTLLRYYVDVSPDAYFLLFFFRYFTLFFSCCQVVAARCLQRLYGYALLLCC